MLEQQDGLTLRGYLIKRRCCGGLRKVGYCRQLHERCRKITMGKWQGNTGVVQF